MSLSFITMQKFNSFNDFYPFYLSQHQNTVCRFLHFVGVFLVLSLILVMLVIKEFKLLLILPFVGYGFAWIGHFIFEKNRPATFKYPFYSLKGDFVMFWQLITGQLSFSSK